MKACEYPLMTNEEYRNGLQELFANVQENYKLRWFFIFTSERLRLDREEKGGAVNE